MKKTYLIISCFFMAAGILGCSSSGDDPVVDPPDIPDQTFLTELSTNALNFSDTQLSANSELTFSIENKGNQVINITDISLPDGFSVNPENTTIAVGASKTFTVTFSPTGIKAHSGTITITSNSTSSGKTISVSGNGTAIPSVTYTANIKVIIDASCATTACHDATGPAAGLSLTNFTEVKAGFENNGAWSRIQSGSMPKNGSLTQNEKDLIESWINAAYAE